MYASLKPQVNTRVS